MRSEILDRVRALGIMSDSEDEIRERLLAILRKNDIDELEEEDTDVLLTIAESFSDTEDDNLLDELAEEVERESVRTRTAVSDALDDMDRNDLRLYIKKRHLDVRTKRHWSDDDVRNAIRNAERASLIQSGVVSEITEKKRGKKIDPKYYAEDREMFRCFTELFPEGEYIYSWMANSGLTIKHKGSNGTRSLVMIQNCCRNGEDLKCALYFPILKKRKEALVEAGIEYYVCWADYPFIKSVSFEGAARMISELMPSILEEAQKCDRRLGDNRQKMEQNLKRK